MVRLKEWETGFYPGLAGLKLDPEHKETSKKLSDSRMLVIRELRDGLSVDTTSYVGRVSLGELRITIDPKIEKLPLADLMRYALDFRQMTSLPRTDQDTADSTFQVLLVAQLIAEAKEQVFRGLKRSYVPQDEYLASPRGKIDFGAFARDGSTKGGKLYCRHFPRIEDSPLNRLLLSGLRLALRITTPTTLRAELQGLISVLQVSVSPVPMTAGLIKSTNRGMNRLTKSYQPILKIITILFNGCGISLGKEEERINLSGFLFDMSRFFQALISRFLHENLETIKVEDEYRIRGMIDYLPGFNPKGHPAPSPRPDFVVRGKTVSILDAKYRDLWDKPLPRDMLYQLCIYALSQEESPASIILYPRTDELASDVVIGVYDPLSRLEKAKVILRPVNLICLRRVVLMASFEWSRLRREMAERLICTVPSRRKAKATSTE